MGKSQSYYDETKKPRVKDSIYVFLQQANRVYSNKKMTVVSRKGGEG